ncbi:DUF2231 domain-containing protein [Saccharicrinis sp. FJH54]|uniref:DUF2231 domain-containing protein n=1 Tax=Saccharicrinis sp. FJH54 TaxID=3344665 RepID=UPI0035D42D92
MIDSTHLHPMIVHFPIALLIVGFIFDIVSLFFRKEFFKWAGFTLLLLGAVGTIAALLSGELAGSGIAEEGMLKQALDVHEAAAELTIWLVSITALFRILIVYLKKYSGFLKALSMILFLASVVAIARTGYYGGELVFKHAAGVELNLGF